MYVYVPYNSFIAQCLSRCISVMDVNKFVFELEQICTHISLQMYIYKSFISHSEQWCGVCETDLYFRRRDVLSQG